MKIPDVLLSILAVVAVILLGYLVLRPASQPVTVSVPAAETGAAAPARTYVIETLLPKDAIPAIDHPRFYSAAEADAEYAPDERVLGVSIGGEHRAYSTALLSRHEIVNDTVGGRKIAVTW